MKTVGIIAEYNPFHNGHQYHMERARAVTGADYVVVVMSGDYTERGIPAIYGKHLRAETALRCGADLVVELPVFGAVSSAVDFARCGVSLLHHMGIADYLCFGSETGELSSLQEQVMAVSEETPEISAAIKEGLKEGLTWPAARARALKTSGLPLSSSPNDILAVEYLRAIEELGSPMVPVPIKRTGPGYHSEETAGTLASATAARKAIFDGDLAALRRVLPETFFQCLEKEICRESDNNRPALSFPTGLEVSFDDFSLLLNQRLLTASLEDLCAVSQMPEDLARKLHNSRLTFHSASELTAWAKDRQYTYSRVNRALLNLALGITKEETESFKATESAPWLRILGFRKEAAPLLSALKKAADRPILTKTASAGERLDDKSLALFQKHLKVSELYRLVAEMKTGRLMKNEFTREICVV